MGLNLCLLTRLETRTKESDIFAQFRMESTFVMEVYGCNFE